MKGHPRWCPQALLSLPDSSFLSFTRPEEARGHPAQHSQRARPSLLHSPDSALTQGRGLQESPEDRRAPSISLEATSGSKGLDQMVSPSSALPDRALA